MSETQRHQVSMDVLPIGSPAALFPVKCPGYSGGVARKLGRDIRANTEGDQKTKPRTRTPIVAVSGSGGSPT